MTDKKLINNTGTTTTTTTQAEPATDASLDVLTPQEEKVLRMVHGLSEDDSHELKFAIGANEETRLQLARLEQFLIESFRAGKAEGSFFEDDADQGVKDKIIASLIDKK